MTVTVSIAAWIRNDTQACVEWHLSLWTRNGDFNMDCSTDLIKIGVVYPDIFCL